MAIGGSGSKCGIFPVRSTCSEVPKLVILIAVATQKRGNECKIQMQFSGHNTGSGLSLVGMACTLILSTKEGEVNQYLII